MIRLPHLLLLFHLCLPKGPAALPALQNPPLQAAVVAAIPAPTIPPAHIPPRATLILMLFLFSVLHGPALHAAAAPALSSRAALHLAVASTLHGPALSVLLGTAWSPARPSNFRHGLIVRLSGHALIISIDLMMALSLVCVATG